MVGKKDRAKVDALIDPETAMLKLSAASTYGKFRTSLKFADFPPARVTLAFALQAYSIDRGPVDRYLDAAVICAFPPQGFKFKDQQPHVTQRGRIVAKPRGSYMAPELTGSVTAAVAFAVQWAPVNWRIIVGNAAVQCRSPEWLARKIVQLTLEHLGK